LTQVNTIGNDFLSNCVNLTSIDLSELIQVKSIGNNFLSNCNSLTSIDLSGLTQLISIGNNFLLNCVRLTSIKCTKNQEQLIRNKLNEQQKSILQVI